MSRRKAAPKRAILPDPLFGSDLIAKFINTVMVSGKKSVAEKIVYGALDIVAQKFEPSNERDSKGFKGGKKGKPDETTPAAPAKTATKKGSLGSIIDSGDARQQAVAAFEAALDKVCPTVEVRSRRVGGSTYQIPVEVRPKRRLALGMRWLVEYAGSRGEKTMVTRLANEILDATHSRGGAVKKRDDTHRMAKANQAFAHYRW